jgi:hypothetical protein
MRLLSTMRRRQAQWPWCHNHKRPALLVTRDRSECRTPSLSPTSPPPGQRTIAGRPTDGASRSSRDLHSGPAAGTHRGHSCRNMDDGVGWKRGPRASSPFCHAAGNRSSGDPAASRYSGRDEDDGNHIRRRVYTEERTASAGHAPHHHGIDDSSGAERAEGVGREEHCRRGEDCAHTRSSRDVGCRQDTMATGLCGDELRTGSMPSTSNHCSPSLHERGAAGYGLQTRHVPEHVASGRESRSELTRAALAARAKRKREEAEEVRARAAAARRSYRPGQMSSEEVEARRREMQGHAGELERSRVNLLRQSQKEDQEEARAATKGRVRRAVLCLRLRVFVDCLLALPTSTRRYISM